VIEVELELNQIKRLYDTLLKEVHRMKSRLHQANEERD